MKSKVFWANPITVLAIGKNKYKETLITHTDQPDKWKAMMEEIEKAEKWEKGKEEGKDRLGV